MNRALMLAILFGAQGASAQAAESRERGTELANPESQPSDSRPATDVRLGERPHRGDALAGEMVTDLDEALDSFEHGENADVSSAFFPTFYTLQGNGKVPLPSRETHLCALHKVKGVMETNAIVRTRYFEDNTQELGALDGNASFSSKAACVPKAKFFNNSPNPISHIFPTKYWFVENGATSYNEEWGNAAAILSGIGGPFRGVGDRAWVWQEPNQVRNVVDIKSDGPGNIIAYSTAFWFNETVGPQKGIKFSGPGGIGSAPAAGEYSVIKTTVGSSSVAMANADNAFCYLTGINGELSKQADSVEILLHPGTHRYVLQVTKTNAGELHAYARCMTFDQR